MRDVHRLRNQESAEEAVQPGETKNRSITGEATVRWPPPGAAAGTIAPFLDMASSEGIVNGRFRDSRHLLPMGYALLANEI